MRKASIVLKFICAYLFMMIGIINVFLAFSMSYLIASSIYTILSAFLPIVFSIYILSNAFSEIARTKHQISSDDEVLANLTKYKSLYDIGAITEEEFNEKKRQILGLF